MKVVADQGCVLVTGAGRGIGHELARRFAADGWLVLATCRSTTAALRLRRLKGTIEVHHLELGDPTAAAQLAERLGPRTIDVLLHVAGVYGPSQDDPAAVRASSWLHAFQVNAVGPVLLTGALLPCLRRARRPRVVALSSSLASLTRNTRGGAYVYRSSKAALQAALVGLAADLSPHGVIVTAIDPGPVSTRMGPPDARRRPMDAARAISALVRRLTARHSGRLFDLAGRALAW